MAEASSVLRLANRSIDIVESKNRGHLNDNAEFQPQKRPLRTQYIGPHRTVAITACRPRLEAGLGLLETQLKIHGVILEAMTSTPATRDTTEATIERRQRPLCRQHPSRTGR